MASEAEERRKNLRFGRQVRHRSGHAYTTAVGSFWLALENALAIFGGATASVVRSTHNGLLRAQEFSDSGKAVLRRRQVPSDRELRMRARKENRKFGGYSPNTVLDAWEKVAERLAREPRGFYPPDRVQRMFERALGEKVDLNRLSSSIARVPLTSENKARLRRTQRLLDAAQVKNQYRSQRDRIYAGPGNWTLFPGHGTNQLTQMANVNKSICQFAGSRFAAANEIVIGEQLGRKAVKFLDRKHAYTEYRRGLDEQRPLSTRQARKAGVLPGQTVHGRSPTGPGAERILRRQFRRGDLSPQQFGEAVALTQKQVVADLAKRRQAFEQMNEAQGTSDALDVDALERTHFEAMATSAGVQLQPLDGGEAKREQIATTERRKTAFGIRFTRRTTTSEEGVKSHRDKWRNGPVSYRNRDVRSAVYSGLAPQYGFAPKNSKPGFEYGSTRKHLGKVEPSDWAVLGVQPGDYTGAKKAFQQANRTLHPDVNDDPKAGEQLRALSAAHDRIKRVAQERQRVIEEAERIMRQNAPAANSKPSSAAESPTSAARTTGSVNGPAVKPTNRVVAAVRSAAERASNRIGLKSSKGTSNAEPVREVRALPPGSRVTTSGTTLTGIDGGKSSAGANPRSKTSATPDSAVDNKEPGATRGPAVGNETAADNKGRVDPARPLRPAPAPRPAPSTRQRANPPSRPSRSAAGAAATPPNPQGASVERLRSDSPSARQQRPDAGSPSMPTPETADPGLSNRHNPNKKGPHGGRTRDLSPHDPPVGTPKLETPETAQVRSMREQREPTAGPVKPESTDGPGVGPLETPHTALPGRLENAPKPKPGQAKGRSDGADGVSVDDETNTKKGPGVDGKDTVDPNSGTGGPGIDL